MSLSGDSCHARLNLHSDCFEPEFAGPKPTVLSGELRIQARLQAHSEKFILRGFKKVMSKKILSPIIKYVLFFFLSFELSFNFITGFLYMLF